MIIGVGIDVVDIERFQATLERTPALRERLFTPTERGLGIASLAARFAAKEATAKSLGAPAGLHWTDAWVVSDGDGRPFLRVAGSVAERAEALGVDSFHVSLSHDAGIASAVVIAAEQKDERKGEPKGERMIEAYAVSDVRAAEAAARAGLPEGELMARAAAGLAAVVAARLEARRGTRVVALVGAGDNGGDALYALADLAARGVTTAAVHGAKAHTAGLEVARAAGVALVDGTAPGWAEVVAEADVLLDGILGIGGRPGLSGDALAWVDAVPEDAWVVAVDLPSGADPAGETAVGDAVFADETVTFGVAKPVHLLPGTEPAVGRLTVVDIGIDAAVRDGGYRPAVERLTFADVRALWPVPDATSDKYSRGVVGIVAGTPTYPGAAVLSVLGSLGAGPGMVRYLGHPVVEQLVHQAAPEVVTAAGRVQAWVLGSGFDPTSRAKGVAEQRRHVLEALASDEPAVVDAGALELLEHRDAPTLLTPHAGELARLLSRLRGEEVTRAAVTAEPLAHARDAAERTGCTVLLKGAHTLVVGPDRSMPVRCQADAPAWVGTAGAGDVLGGLLGTLLAAGLHPLDAGALGALVHGVAADDANPGGPVRISEVARRIPATVAALLRYA